MAEQQVHVRPGVPADAGVLADFNTRIAAETEGLALVAGVVLAGVQAVLADPGKGRYFVAELDGRPAGCLMVTREWSDWRNGDIWWIQSVYVHPDFRRRGVFTALYRTVEDQARSAGVRCLRLYMEHANHSARETYVRMGMHDSGYVVLEKTI